MNTKNLIMTPVKDMTREEWLQWRQPMFHVEQFLNNWVKEVSGVDHGWRKEITDYPNFLKYVFDSERWQQFLFPCIGGSEIASVVGLNPYKSVIELFYEKVGLKDPWNEENAAMFWGKHMEDFIAEMWQFWEGPDQEQLFKNFNAGNVVRRCRRCNFYVQNKEFPWLFVSLDRIINKVGEREEGSLECKTIASWAAKVWENGIPPMYVAQNQSQLLVCGFNYGELAIFKDGREYEVFPFDYHPAICDRLKKESQIFFANVKKAIEYHLLFQVTGNEQYKAEIDNLSPDPDGSISYQNFLKEQYKERGGEVIGGEVQLHLAKAYAYCNERMKDFETIQIEASNKLKAYMKENSIIDFGKEGTVTWKANAKGVRSFRCQVKHEPGFVPDPEILKTIEEIEVFSDENLTL